MSGQSLALQHPCKLPFQSCFEQVKLTLLSYFSTKVLPGLGPLQDGGVRANNPLSIALRESSMVWPAAERHDLLLSVGTGWSSSVHNPSPGYHSRLWEGALPRLLRALMFSPSMDGKQGYFEALNYLPHHSKPDAFRLDHEIHGPMPELDDISSLDKLFKMDFAVPDQLVRAVLATAMFFFELDEIPVRSHDSFQCRGSILCARPGAILILQRVLVEFPGARFQTSHGCDLGNVSPLNCCHSCGYFRKPVTFPVASLGERLSIEIVNSTHCERIGGFPTSTQKLLDNQQAFAPFGRADHLVLEWPRHRQCSCHQGGKRQVQFSDPPCLSKKRRL